MYNLYNFEAEFKYFLQSKKVSPATLKNYLSDFRHFWKWFLSVCKNNGKLDLEHDLAILTHFSTGLFQQYKDFLVLNGVCPATINRRFATIRKFIGFCQENNWIHHNPVENLSNISSSLNQSSNTKQQLTKKVLEEFSEYILLSKLSPVTKRNYTSDIRHFFNWIEQEANSF